jgi:hypothetical protein
MSDYSGPYDGREHDPSEMRGGGGKAKETRRPEGEDRAEGEERPGDEGEGEDAGEQDRGRGTGPAVTGPPPSPES